MKTIRSNHVSFIALVVPEHGMEKEVNGLQQHRGNFQRGATLPYGTLMRQIKETKVCWLTQIYHCLYGMPIKVGEHPPKAKKNTDLVNSLRVYIHRLKWEQKSTPKSEYLFTWGKTTTSDHVSFIALVVPEHGTAKEVTRLQQHKI